MSTSKPITPDQVGNASGANPMDGVYHQRNQLAIAFAYTAHLAGMKAGRAFDTSKKALGWDDEWCHVVYVDLPDGGQVSWHMSPEAVPLMTGLPTYDGVWNGEFTGRNPAWVEGLIFCG